MTTTINLQEAGYTLHTDMKNKKFQVKSGKNVRNKLDKGFIVKVVISTFLITVFIAYICQEAFTRLNLYISIVFVLSFIIVGIIFDIIGVAAATGDEKPFHAMNSKKIKSAKTALRIIRNAEKVSNLCNDVIGDICGVVSGSAGAAVSVKLSDSVNASVLKIIIPLLTIAFIAAFTIFGKAIGKSVAINYNNTIIYRISALLSIFFEKR